ncbi:hypothetical protein GCM10007907_16890 [Chitinimonas prasina]|uniref:Helix-turn-helix transcriptional regulator n=1 Tax=Chitinimonas prasina TaxID=1434937 RepID=A0ABQ5YIW1_9NEIS|nr:hypothetical protein [Chitinimonas prasina]GLR12899.1 hypothetical protein GCM10007907_16890 [Chitinimonas prasina]
MQRAPLPFCHGVNQAAVCHVAQEAKPTANKLAKHYGVSRNQMAAWLSGKEEMPRMLYELLALKLRCELPETCGLFAGWTIIGGERFTGPNLEKAGGLHWSDIDRLPEFRRLDNLASRQSDLIARLTKERDFYKRQCHLETRHSLLLRKMFD